MDDSAEESEDYEYEGKLDDEYDDNIVFTAKGNAFIPKTFYFNSRVIIITNEREINDAIQSRLIISTIPIYLTFSQTIDLIRELLPELQIGEGTKEISIEFKEAVLSFLEEKILPIADNHNFTIDIRLFLGACAWYEYSISGAVRNPDFWKEKLVKALIPREEEE